MDGGRLPNRVMFGGMEGPGQRGAGWKGKELMDCVAETFGRLVSVGTGNLPH